MRSIGAVEIGIGDEMFARCQKKCPHVAPGDLAIAIAAVLPGQCDGVGGEPLFVFTAPRYLALRRAALSERRTGAALGDMHDRLDLPEFETTAWLGMSDSNRRIRPRAI